jgi:hypothetical protein
MPMSFGKALAFYLGVAKLVEKFIKDQAGKK